MPLSEMGSAPALLSTATQAAGQQARAKEAQQTQTQNAMDQSQRLPNQIAEDKMANQLQMVTITPQLAAGAKKITGDDSWDRAVGTKMDSRIYSGLLSSGAQMAYHQNLLEDRDRLEQMREESRSREDKSKSDSAKELTDLKDKHNKELEEIRAQHAKELEALRGRNRKDAKAGGEDPKDKEFLKTYRQNQKDTQQFNYAMYDNLAKTDKKQADDLKDKLDFVTQNKERFDKLQGMGGNDQAAPGASGDKNAKAKDWLKKKYPKLTNPSDHDIEWALGQMKNG